jgi:hypothetical protein
MAPETCEDVDVKEVEMDDLLLNITHCRKIMNS